MKESWDWLRRGDLKRGTEALIMTAQEQALNKNSVLENEDIKIFWDFSFQLDRRIDHYRPDIVLFEKKSRHCLIIDVAIPSDHRIVIKEQDKISEYGTSNLKYPEFGTAKLKLCQSSLVH